MRRIFGTAFWIVFTFAIPAFAQGERTYTPGFNGSVSQLLVPLDAGRFKNRFLTLKIRFAEKPVGHAVAFDKAFRAACQLHQAELLQAAKRLSLRIDWRVKLVFLWPVAASDGVAISRHDYKFMWLNSCRPASAKAG